MAAALSAGGVARSGAAQRSEVIVGPNVQVSSSRPRSPYNEGVIAGHPTDARRLIACSMLEPGPNRSVKSAAWVSVDAGRSWSRPNVTTAHWANDPTCGWDASGTAYFVHKTNDGYPTPAGAVNSDFDYLGIERTRDNGRSWLPMIRGPQTNDRPFMALDQQRRSLYVAYNGHVHGEENRHDNASFRNTVALMRSDDGGATFNAAAQRALMDQTEVAGSNAGTRPFDGYDRCQSRWCRRSDVVRPARFPGQGRLHAAFRGVAGRWYHVHAERSGVNVA
jgi:hypothetical protein